MQRTELLKAVEATMIGVAKSGSPMGLDFLVFAGDWVRSFNDELSVSCQIQTGVKGAVKAHELVKILNKMKGDTIRIANEKGQLLIKDSNTTLRMTQMENDSLGKLQEQIESLNTQDLKWKLLPERFTEGFTTCLFAAGTAPELGVLSGVAFTKDQIIATDNYRVTVYVVNGKIPEDFVLPTSVINGLRQLGKEFESISITGAWVHFKDEGGLVVSVRRLLGDYPFEHIIGLFDTNFPKSGKAKSYDLPKGIEKSIELAEILAGSGEEGMDFLTQISLKKVGKNLVIKGEKDIGTIEDKVLWPEGEGFPEGMELKVSPIFLKKIIRVSTTFQLSPNNTTILFKGENFRHLMVAKIN